MIGENKYLLIGAGVMAALLLYLIKKPGAAASAGQAVGEAAVDAVEGVATGVVGGIGGIVGLPSPSETITDAEQCRLYLNEHGYWAASAACSAPAFIEATVMSMKD